MFFISGSLAALDNIIDEAMVSCNGFQGVPRFSEAR
jgi:hypothetical protein